MPATGPEKCRNEKGLELTFEPFFRIRTMVNSCRSTVPVAQEQRQRQKERMVNSVISFLSKGESGHRSTEQEHDDCT
jgi:hypothetical protein